MDDEPLVIRWSTPGDCVPTHFEYAIAENHDVTNGEFWLNAFGRATETRHGVGMGWLEAYLSAPRCANDGTVKNVGLWARCHTGGGILQCFSLGVEIETDYWLAGLLTFRAAYSHFGPHIQNLEIVEFAFFADVLRLSGGYVRLWQSRHGTNYTLQDAFNAPGFMKSTEHGTVEYAGDDSVLFEEKRRRS